MFIFSTNLGSAEHTSGFLGPLIHFLFPDLSPKGLDNTLFFIRKSAHIFEYAVLSVLWFSALTQDRENSWKTVYIALGVAITYACFDELHQRFVPTRTGSLIDVGIDSLGAIFGLAIWKGCPLLLPVSTKIKLRYFGWWFAWGCFSTIMLLIVMQGGGLLFEQMLYLIFFIGIVSGTGGFAYRVYYSR